MYQKKKKSLPYRNDICKGIYEFLKTYFTIKLIPLVRSNTCAPYGIQQTGPEKTQRQWWVETQWWCTHKTRIWHFLIKSENSYIWFANKLWHKCGEMYTEIYIYIYHRLHVHNHKSFFKHVFYLSNKILHIPVLSYLMGQHWYSNQN